MGFILVSCSAKTWRRVLQLPIHESRTRVSSQPYFPPERIFVLRIEAMMIAPGRDAIENDAFVAESHHGSRLWIDDLFDAGQHAVDTVAVLDHFRVEPHAAILVVRVQRRDDLVVALDLHPFAGTQVESFAWSLAQRAVPVWKGLFPSLVLNAVVPRHQQAVTADVTDEETEKPEQKGARQLPHGGVSGPPVPKILARIPP